MPDVKIYIRAEDIDKWNAIEKKAEFIHNALNSQPIIFPTNSKGVPIQPQKHIPVIKTEEDAKKVVEQIVAKPVTYKKTQNWGA